MSHFIKRSLLVWIFLQSASLFSQNTYTFTYAKKDVDCIKGAASVKIEGLETGDTLLVNWSTGESNIFTLSNLKEGSYNVEVIIKNKTKYIDTTYFFQIDDQGCKVPISNHFTPNGDNYNDTWNIANTSFYPNFELYVFNKWGQQVHSQKGTYTPWDGRWNGINVPDGTYYYVFYYDGGNKGKHEKGDVTILR